MRILFLGDLIGRGGREAVYDHLPALRARREIDFVIANCENVAGGVGVTRVLCDALFAAGVDALTSGNHVWDQHEVFDFMDDEPRLLRPMNYPAQTPGRGVSLLTARGGETVMVMNAMGQVFMPVSMDDPFAAVDAALGHCPLGEVADAIVLDFHGEATSEKMAMGHFADGRASLVVGTHTHVPTADAQILPGGTAYLTDAGMCGDYDSVIGMDKETSIARFTHKMRMGHFTPVVGDVTLCGVLVETALNGLAASIEPLRLGGRLAEAQPYS